jgi:hypothetical protein
MVLPGLFAFSFALAGLLLSSDLRGQEPSQGTPRKHTFPLSEADRKVLATIGWPKPLPPLPPPQDAVYARDGQVLSGALTFLEAFATVKQGSSKKDIARDKVGFVLVAGKPFPKSFGQLPNDDDAVLLDSGEMVTGYVNVDAGGIHVKARTFRKEDVTLIRLKGPPETQYPDIVEPPDSAGEEHKPGKKHGDSGSPRKPEPPRGHGPEEIPWGKALWRGFFRYRWAPNQKALQEQERLLKYNNRPDLHPGITGPVRVSYYVTWQEDFASGDSSGNVFVKMKIANLVYQGVFPGCLNQGAQTFAGSGFDVPLYLGGANPHSSMGFNPVAAREPVPHGFLIWPPTAQRVYCDGQAGPYDGFIDALPVFQTWQKGLVEGCELPGASTPPPYTTISNSFSCSGEWGERHIDYAFIRGAPPLNVEPESCSACQTAQGLVAREEDFINVLLEELKKLGDEIAKAQSDLDGLNRVKASMHDQMNLLLVAAASQDVAERLLEIVRDDGATQIGGALEEESEYGRRLKGFVECLLAGKDAFFAMAGDDAHDYVDYVKGLPRAASRPGCLLTKGDVKIEKMTSDSFGNLINAAKEELELWKVLADAIGQGSGKAEAEYIQEHLDKLGPLVPEEVLQKVQQYLQLTEQWTEKLREIEELTLEVAKVTFALADHGVTVKALEEGMGECPQSW